MFKNFRCGEQPLERVEMLQASHHFLFTMKHTLPPLVLFDSAVLSARSTKNESDGVMAWSGTVGVSHVSVSAECCSPLCHVGR